MARTYLTPINLTQNELQNAVVQNLAAPAAGSKPGQLYYSTALSCGMVYNGTAYVPTDASKLSGTIPIGALVLDPTQRANHTGTQTASTISNLQTTVQGYSLSGFAAPTANIPMAGYTFTGLPAATASGQPMEYAQGVALVQNAAAGISSKQPVAAVAAANIASLSGAQTVDGVSLAAGQRVLLTAQTTASQNGPWVVGTGAWTRPTTEGGTQGELDAGALWLALGGTANSGTQWRLATTGTITPGTTAVSILQFGAGMMYSAGPGLVLTGSALALNPVAGGGLVATAAGASVDITVTARKFAATIGDGSSTTYTVAHNLGTRDVTVHVYQAASPYGQVEADVNHTDANDVSVVFAAAPASGAYRVLVVG